MRFCLLVCMFALTVTVCHCDDLPPAPPIPAGWIDDPLAEKDWDEATDKKNDAIAKEPLIEMHDQYIGPHWVSLYDRIKELNENLNNDPVLEGYSRLILLVQPGETETLQDRFISATDAAEDALGNAELAMTRLRPLAAGDNADATAVWRLASFALIYFGKYETELAKANPLADQIELILDSADTYRLGSGQGY